MATTNLYFVSSISGSVTNPENALGAPNAVFTTDENVNTAWTHEWALDTVSGSAIGTQTFTLRVKKGSNSGDPTVTSIILKQDGVAVTANLLGSDFTVTSTTGEDIQVTTSGTFATIANLSLEIVTSGVGGSPSARNAVSIDAVTYLADYLAGIFGTFAVSEIGDDTIASTGKVIVQGSIGIGEVGADTFVSTTGTVLVQGTLASTEANDTITSTGTVLVQGTLLSTEVNDTIISTGKVIVKGALSVSEPAVNDTITSTGKVIVQGPLVTTEIGNDTFVAATGTVLVKGALVSTEASDTITSTGTILIQGIVLSTEANDTLTSTGKVIVKGALAVSEVGIDTYVSSTGKVIVQGSLAVSEVGNDTFVPTTGTVLVKGSFLPTEANDTIISIGEVQVQGIMSSEGALDTASFIGQVYSDKTIILSAQKTQPAYFEAILPPLIKVYRLSNAA